MGVSSNIDKDTAPRPSITLGAVEMRRLRCHSAPECHTVVIELRFVEVRSHLMDVDILVESTEIVLRLE